MFLEDVNRGVARRSSSVVKTLLSLFVVLAFALTICPSKTQAQIVGDLEVNVPFQFHAGNAKFPAGKYRIHMLEDSDLSIVEIASADGTMSALFQVEQSDSKTIPAKSELIFNRYGNRYFLSQLFDEGNQSGSRVIESRYEKRVSQLAMNGQEHVPAYRGGK